MDANVFTSFQSGSVPRSSCQVSSTSVSPALPPSRRIAIGVSGNTTWVFVSLIYGRSVLEKFFGSKKTNSLHEVSNAFSSAEEAFELTENFPNIIAFIVTNSCALSVARSTRAGVTANSAIEVVTEGDVPVIVARRDFYRKFRGTASNFKPNSTARHLRALSFIDFNELLYSFHTGDTSPLDSRNRSPLLDAFLQSPTPNGGGGKDSFLHNCPPQPRWDLFYFSFFSYYYSLLGVLPVLDKIYLCVVPLASVSSVLPSEPAASYLDFSATCRPPQDKSTWTRQPCPRSLESHSCWGRDVEAAAGEHAPLTTVYRVHSAVWIGVPLTRGTLLSSNEQKDAIVPQSEKKKLLPFSRQHTMSGGSSADAQRTSHSYDQTTTPGAERDSLLAGTLGGTDYVPLLPGGGHCDLRNAQFSHFDDRSESDGYIAASNDPLPPAVFTGGRSPALLSAELSGPAPQGTPLAVVLARAANGSVVPRTIPGGGRDSFSSGQPCEGSRMSNNAPDSTISLSASRRTTSSTLDAGIAYYISFTPCSVINSVNSGGHYYYCDDLDIGGTLPFPFCLRAGGQTPQLGCDKANDYISESEGGVGSENIPQNGEVGARDRANTKHAINSEYNEFIRSEALSELLSMGIERPLATQAVESAALLLQGQEIDVARLANAAVDIVFSGAVPLSQEEGVRDLKENTATTNRRRSLHHPRFAEDIKTLFECDANTALRRPFDDCVADLLSCTRTARSNSSLSEKCDALQFNQLVASAHVCSKLMRGYNASFVIDLNELNAAGEPNEALRSVEICRMQNGVPRKVRTTPSSKVHVVLLGRQNCRNPGPRYHSRGLNHNVSACFETAVRSSLREGAAGGIENNDATREEFCDDFYPNVSVGNDHIYELIMWQVVREVPLDALNSERQQSPATAASNTCTEKIRNSDRFLDDFFSSSSCSSAEQPKPSSSVSQKTTAATTLKDTTPKCYYRYARHTFLRGTVPVRWTTRTPSSIAATITTSISSGITNIIGKQERSQGGGSGGKQGGGGSGSGGAPSAAAVKVVFDTLTQPPRNSYLSALRLPTGVSAGDPYSAAKNYSSRSSNPRSVASPTSTGGSYYGILHGSLQYFDSLLLQLQTRLAGYDLRGARSAFALGDTLQADGFLQDVNTPPLDVRIRCVSLLRRSITRSAPGSSSTLVGVSSAARSETEDEAMAESEDCFNNNAHHEEQLSQLFSQAVVNRERFHRLGLCGGGCTCSNKTSRPRTPLSTCDDCKRKCNHGSIDLVHVDWLRLCAHNGDSKGKGAADGISAAVQALWDATLPFFTQVGSNRLAPGREGDTQDKFNVQHNDTITTGELFPRCFYNITDISRTCKGGGEELFSADLALSHSFFVSGPDVQRRFVRINCADSLDRTNLASFFLASQISVKLFLGIINMNLINPSQDYSSHNQTVRRRGLRHYFYTFTSGSSKQGAKILTHPSTLFVPYIHDAETFGVHVQDVNAEQSSPPRGGAVRTDCLQLGRIAPTQQPLPSPPRKDSPRAHYGGAIYVDKNSHSPMRRVEQRGTDFFDEFFSNEKIKMRHESPPAFRHTGTVTPSDLIPSMFSLGAEMQQVISPISVREQQQQQQQQQQNSHITSQETNTRAKISSPAVFNSEQRDSVFLRTRYGYPYMSSWEDLVAEGRLLILRQLSLIPHLFYVSSLSSAPFSPTLQRDGGSAFIERPAGPFALPYVLLKALALIFLDNGNTISRIYTGSNAMHTLTLRAFCGTCVSSDGRQALPMLSAAALKALERVNAKGHYSLLPITADSTISVQPVSLMSIMAANGSEANIYPPIHHGKSTMGLQSDSERGGGGAAATESSAVRSEKGFSFSEAISGKLGDARQAALNSYNHLVIVSRRQMQNTYVDPGKARFHDLLLGRNLKQHFPFFFFYPPSSLRRVGQQFTPRNTLFSLKAIPTSYWNSSVVVDIPTEVPQCSTAELATAVKSAWSAYAKLNGIGKARNTIPVGTSLPPPSPEFIVWSNDDLRQFELSEIAAARRNGKGLGDSHFYFYYRLIIINPLEPLSSGGNGSAAGYFNLKSYAEDKMASSKDAFSSILTPGRLSPQLDSAASEVSSPELSRSTGDYPDLSENSEDDDADSSEDEVDEGENKNTNQQDGGYNTVHPPPTFDADVGKGNVYEQQGQSGVRSSGSRGLFVILSFVPVVGCMIISDGRTPLRETPVPPPWVTAGSPLNVTTAHTYDVASALLSQRELTVHSAKVGQVRLSLRPYYYTLGKDPLRLERARFSYFSKINPQQGQLPDASSLKNVFFVFHSISDPPFFERARGTFPVSTNRNIVIPPPGSLAARGGAPFAPVRGLAQTALEDSSINVLDYLRAIDDELSAHRASGSEINSGKGGVRYVFYSKNDASLLNNSHGRKGTVEEESGHGGHKRTLHRGGRAAAYAAKKTITEIKQGWKTLMGL